ncbi:MAG TPA: polymer-forming cytoskeletal protein [Bacteroidetes bacterium]|nr:polymer-forming cytoskeletal protein [Bacteroidota bacterium]
MLKNKGRESMDKMGDLNTLIGKGAIIEGNLTLQHSLRMDGKLIGNIKSTDSIIIGKDGEVEGEIEVKNAVVGGKIKGKIVASGKVTLETTSVFNGQLKANKLVIDEGSVFDGTSQMGDGNFDKTTVKKDSVKDRNG